MFMQKLEPEAPQSQIPQTGEFAKVRSHIIKIQNSWDSFYQQLSQLESPYAEEFRKHNSDFSRAVDKILTAIETPTLTLATTGTTSSGKSTLVNLLCGADIMPRMAGEMSAGIVTIKHSANGKRLLKIEKTPGASWECGEWKNLSDSDSRVRLTKTMDAFNKAKQKQELASPVIELTYPIACFFPNAGLLDLSDLPTHTQFQIMDLPGKRNQDDQINSAVIQNCRRALSIVTYNMEETDEKLRQSLMEEVLEQVKLMGGSPARMLFALNRVDVFRKDPDWVRREREAADQTIMEIKKIIHDRLPEHRNTLDKLSYSKLSSLPALLAWQVRTNLNNNREAIADQLDDHFNFMLSDEVKDDLPRSIKRWDEGHFQQVQKTVWENSYANSFFPVLERHIKDNFAKLIIAPLLVEFENVISHIIGQANRTCMIEIESSKRQYHELKTKLDDDYHKIKHKLQVAFADLMSLPDAIKQDPSIPETLRYKKIFRDSEIYNTDVGVSALKGFSTSIREPITWLSGVSEGATQSLKSGRMRVTGTKAEDLSLQHEDKLKIACHNLMGAGYTKEIAEKGHKAEAAWDGEKESLEKLKNGISNYASAISELMQDIYEQRVSRENRRIKELLENIVYVFISHVNTVIAKNNLMLNVRFDTATLHDINLSIPSLKFSVTVKSTTHVERNPWLLWLSQRDVTYADIPSADALHAMIVSYLDSIRTQASKPLQEAISTYYKEIDIKMTQYISSINDDVQSKFEAVYKNGATQHKQQEETWMKLNHLADAMTSNMQALTNYKA